MFLFAKFKLATLLPFFVLFAIIMSSTAYSQNVRSRYYKVESDLDGETLKSYVVHMDKMYGEYVRRFRSGGLKPFTKEKLNLYIWSTNKKYMEHLKTFGIDGTGSGGMFFISGRTVGVTTFIGGQSRDQVISTLQHEGFHQFALQYIGYEIPIWMNEGIAGYYEDAVSVGGRLQTGQVSSRRYGMITEAVKSGKYMKLDQLFAMSHKQWNENVRRGGNASMQYLVAWSVVHFMMQDRKLKKLLNKYLVMINKGVEMDEAFKKAFNMTPGQIEKEWVAFVKNKLEIDALSDSKEFMMFISSGMITLHAQKIKFKDDIEDIKNQLKKIKYQVRLGTRQFGSTLKANDKGVLDTPKTKFGKDVKIAVTKRETPDSFPTIKITGVAPSLTLNIGADKNGYMVYDIIYK